MTGWIEIIIGVIILGSVAISLIRGFVKEAISLVSWVVAIWVGIVYSQPVSHWFSFPQNASLRAFLAFVVLFVLCIFVGAIVNLVIGRLVRKTPFSMPDRIIGSLFGFFRGALIVLVLVLLGGLTPLPEQPWWKNSVVIMQFEHAAKWVRQYFPEDIADLFLYREVEGKKDTDVKSMQASPASPQNGQARE